MPRDLFGEVDRPSTHVGTRSRYTVPLSLAAHALVIAGILAAAVLGPAVLPSPASGELILLADMHIPEPPPPRIVAATTTPVAAVNPNAAPVVAPDHVAPEVLLPDDLHVSTADVTGLVAGAADFTTVVGEPPAPPPPAPVQPVPVGGKVRPPAKTVDVPPVYPPLAIVARVLRSISLLDAAALSAVGQWAYTPTLLNGVAVPVIMTVTVTFKLH